MRQTKDCKLRFCTATFYMNEIKVFACINYQEQSFLKLKGKVCFKLTRKPTFFCIPFISLSKGKKRKTCHRSLLSELACVLDHVFSLWRKQKKDVFTCKQVVILLVDQHSRDTQVLVKNFTSIHSSHLKILQWQMKLMLTLLLIVQFSQSTGEEVSNRHQTSK